MSLLFNRESIMSKALLLPAALLALLAAGVRTPAQAQSSPSFAYAANTEGTISGYRIDPASGALTALPGSPFATIRSPSTMAVGGQGRFVYVGNLNVGEIAGYVVDRASGVPHPIPGSPFHPPGTAGGSSIGNLVVDASGRFLVALNPGGNDVAVLAIDAETGALTSAAGSPYATAIAPGSLAVDPAGRFVYAFNPSASTLSAWSMDPGSGALRPLAGAPFPVARIPGWYPGALTIAPGGKFAFQFWSGGGGTAILRFTLNRDNGSLIPIGTPVPASPHATQLQFDPLGDFVYSIQPGLTALFSYQFDATSGGITLASASPYPTDPAGYPSSVAFDPSGRYAYVASGTGRLVLYAVDADTGALQFNGPYPSGQALVLVVVAEPGATKSTTQRRAPQPFPKAANAQTDPNLPAGNNSQSLPLRWTVPASATVPVAWFNGAWRAESGQHARYLGFNAEGSWLEHADDHHIYVWNLKTLELTRRFDSLADMPPSLHSALQNAPPPMTEAASATARADTSHAISATRHPEEEEDPNFPKALANNGSTGLPVTWLAGGGTVPQLMLHFDAFYNTAGAEYLGFNERGAWMVSAKDGRVYVWDMRTLTLLQGANSLREIPKDVMRSLRNAQSSVRAVLGEDHKAAAVPATAQPVPVAPRGGGMFDDAARRAVADLGATQPARHAGAAGSFTATGASIKGSILTVTLADGSTQSMPVERPPTTTPTHGISGTWISYGDTAKKVAGKMVVIQDDGSAKISDLDPRLEAMFRSIKNQLK